MAHNKLTILGIAGFVACTLSLAGCGSGDDEPAAAKPMNEPKTMEQELEQGAKQLAEAFTGVATPVTVVDHKALKEMLPNAIPGLKRISANAERRGAMGFNVSQASAEYRSDAGDGVLSLSIDDIGSAGALAKLGLDMMEYEQDSETENGFERTGKYRGYRSIEKMQKQGGHSLSEMTVFVGDRFIVRIDAQDLPFEQVIEVADGIDLDALADMDTGEDSSGTEQ